MKTVMVANPCAAAGRVARSIGEIEQAVKDRFGSCRVDLSEAAGDIEEKVRFAIRDGAQRIVIVGGDGTVNEAVNGAVDPGTGKVFADCPPFVFLSVGTGGDFARSIGSSGLPFQDVLSDLESRRVDLGRLALGVGGAHVRHFINIASVGVTACVADHVNRHSKRFGGKLSFMSGAVAALTSWKDIAVSLTLDDAPPMELNCSFVAMANGRYFGSGMMVAPSALIDDGLFDVVVGREMGVMKFLLSGRKMYKGTHVHMPQIEVVRARRIEISAPLGGRTALAECEGEVPGGLPLVCTMEAAAIEVLAPFSRCQTLSR